MSKHCILFVFLAFALTIHVPARASESVIAYSKENQYRAADRDFIKFSSEFFHALVKSEKTPRYRNINTLLNRAQQDYTQQHPARAIRLIVANTGLIDANINTNAIIGIERLLLKANEVDTAQRILAEVNNQSDPSIVANVQFAFAKYYYSHDQWGKTISTIKAIANDLPAHNFQHAMLMQGISLQNIQKHRKALVVYKKISPDSRYYIAARINMAVANIRQDWWTDAYDILTKLLHNPKVQHNKLLTDRINTIIGYTFLQQDYYRNSRDAFRKVELHGAYTNQALLGIALDAGYQKDYVGALNASRILKHKHDPALQVDEAHLLLPYFYEKLGQMATASAGYTDAIKYYEGRLRDIKTAMSSSLDYLGRAQQNSKSTQVSIKGENIDLGDYLPPAFFIQLALLNTYGTDVNTIGKTRLHSQYSKLVNSYKKIIRGVVNLKLKQKSSYITDYMNQCRYGLARLYDKNLSDVK